MAALRKAVLTEKLPLKNFLYTSFVICMVGIVLVYLSQRNLPPEVPLFYGLPEGDEQLTTSQGLVIPYLAALAIILINTVVVYFTRNSFLQKTLVLTSFAISILSFITTIKITLLIGNF